METDPVVATGDSTSEVYSDAIELAFDAIKTAETRASSISKVDMTQMADLWTKLAIAVELRKVNTQLEALVAAVGSAKAVTL